MTETSNASKTNESLGITQRTTPLAIPWTGELRVRFTDFLVNEITEDGTVVHLTEVASNEEKPRPSSEGAANGQDAPASTGNDAQKREDGEGESKPRQPADAVEVSPEDQAALASLAGEAFVRGCIELLAPPPQEAADTPEAKEKPPPPQQQQQQRVTAEPTDDRGRRAQIHQEVRRIFRSRLETSTDESGAIVAVAVERQRGKKRGRGGGRRGQPPPPPDADQQQQQRQPRRGEYLHFTMYKENRDTMDAVNQIARMLRMKPQLVAYAGTKDRRAATAQRLSIRRLQVRALAGTNPKLRGISTGNYEYKDHALHLGQLAGNEFVITIKNCRLAGDGDGDGDGDGAARSTEDKVKALEANVQPALRHLAEHGWINYFGHQRFGTHETGTHEIGKLILGGRYEDAVTALLSYDPEIAARAEAGEVGADATERDTLLRHQACMLFMTGKDRARAEELIPRRFIAENCILRHLNRGGEQSRRDFVGALVHITRGLRTMYMHAYQSHVWNHVASRRWERHGSQVVQGDLVVAEEDGSAAQTPGRSQGQGQDQDQDQDGGDVINPTEPDDERPVRARPLTEEEAASGRYTIHDVVLPLAGYDVIYPDNDTGAFYAEFMARPENGALNPDSMRRLRREFSLAGRYRKLMNRFLAEPSVEVRAYTHDTDQMHPTDLDLVKQAKANEDGAGADADADADADAPASKRPRTEEPAPPPKTEGEEDTPMLEPAGQAAAEEAQKIAVIVKFQLGSSAYATVALRELMGDIV